MILKVAAVAAFAFGFATHAQAQVLISPRTLSLDAAHQVAKATLDACRKNGFNVTVIVLDRNGRARVTLHDDNANPHTVENARRKAYTSLTFRVNTMEYGKRFTGENRPPMLEGITTAAGGMVIKAGNDVVGSIGVSGAPGGDKDQACAEVGLATIAEGLK
jgi:uncharacterized protein GlcG (DUF336 family)